MKRKRKATSWPPDKVRTWLTEPLSHDVRRAIDRLVRADDVQRVAVMPDVHLAAGVCVGNVLATSRLLYPQAVGADIGCGMAAIAFAGEARLLDDESAARAVLNTLRAAAPVMRHRSRDAAPSLPDEVQADTLSAGSLASAAQREGRVELGTLGRGNHFLEFQADDDGRLWLMVHSGSRAMGQIITQWHAARATRAGGGFHYLDADTPEGQAYLNDAAWAERFADANRAALLDAGAGVVQRHLGIAVVADSRIGCNHNHVRREEHAGATLWVHRKGACSAADGEPALIPGSMGTQSFHVVGRGCAEALRSSSHGAGRAMSRHDARRRISTRHLHRQLAGVWFDERLAAGLREEAPAAYKDIDAVFRAQTDLTRITRRLRPVLCYKGV